MLEVQLLSDFDWFFEELENGRIDYVLFLSAYAAQALLRSGGPRALSALSGAKVLAIGPGTASKLKKVGVRVDDVPEEHSSKGLAKLLQRYSLRNKRIALPRVEGVSLALRADLEKFGAEVVEFPAYRLVPVESKVREFLGALAEGSVDVVLFTCPSAVHVVFRIVEKAGTCANLSEITIVAFGPATRQALQQHGVEPRAMPSTYSYEGVSEVLKKLKP